MIDFDGKCVLVTGASRGIGAVTARTLGGAGAHVICHYGTNRTAAEAVAADIGTERAAVIAAGVSLWITSG